ncbi:hypothetical protein ACFXDE_36810 [Kitasatospora sp. NPDC059408]|uniref:hypothetical protein n=1 Tax=Kitasatospora sp. NPDC059408 TaxID=3346823 RepID=UPI0036C70834
MPLSMMLQGRIEALESHLNRARDAAESRLPLEGSPVREEDWKNAFESVHDESQIELVKLANLRDRLDGDDGLALGEGWRQFATIQEESERIFRECLELLGGLVFRDRRLDGDICHLADALMREQAAHVGKAPAIAIPSHDAAVTAAPRRIAHVRFPEWDVWTLPLVAHEYGRLAITESKTIKTFMEELEANAVRELGVGRPEVEQRVRLLLADAFGAFTTGPAYACALMLLRLDLISATPASRALVDQRVRMVCGMVDAADDAVDHRIQNGIHGTLATWWKEAINSLPPPLPGPGGPLDGLTIDPGSVYKQFSQYSWPYVGYDQENWLRAQEWGTAWLKQLELNNDPVKPKIVETDKLRDVLNASWYVRMRRPEWTTKGAGITRSLCQEIADAQQRPRKKKSGRATPKPKPEPARW